MPGLSLSTISTSDALSQSLALAPVFRVEGSEAISISGGLSLARAPISLSLSLSLSLSVCVCVCVCVCACVRARV